MGSISVHLLGNLQVTLDSVIVTDFRSAKSLALLSYFAAEGSSPHPRSTLAALLWPDQSHEAAHRNLRLTLHRLRQALGDTGEASHLFEITRKTIRLQHCSNTAIDTVRFESLVAPCDTCQKQSEAAPCGRCFERLTEALSLYRGDFLTGFSLDGNVPFMEWVTVRREFYHLRALDALDRLITYHERRRSWDEVCACARRQLELEPWLERAHRSLMNGLARSGRRSAALAQYEQCRQMLAEHLGVVPDWETRALYERIQVIRSTSVSGRRRHVVPFIGRETEQAELSDLLVNPDCRLVTLVGPGGIGKTRLAQQLAEQQLETGRYLNGVHFISFDDRAAPKRLVPAIAQGLGIHLREAEKPVAQLQRFLHDKEMLLVLDSYEQVDEDTDALVALLQGAPALQLLITSREVVNIKDEWLYPLQGLPVPPEDTASDIASYAAFHLFVERARRINPQATFVHEQMDIARICRLVDGIPLAVELAAVWSKFLSCAGIAEQIEQQLAFLSTTLSDVPERHRSMLAAFDQSWHYLGETERLLFRRLSVFRGGFDYDAAREVAGASPEMLGTLLDKSLLFRTSEERYTLHRLLRQYAYERLAESPEDLAAVRERHARYYVRLLARQQWALFGGGQHRAIACIVAEQENIQVAWEWVLKQSDLSSMADGLQSLALFYQYQGRQVEGRDFLMRTVDCLDRQKPETETQRVLALALAYLGWMLFQLGDLARAEMMLQRSRGLYDDLDIPPPQGPRSDPRLTLAGVLFAWGERDAALALLDNVRTDNERIGHKLNLQTTYCGYATIALAEGHYEEARRAAAQSYALAQSTQDQWFIAYCLVALGDTERLLGQYGRAKRRYWKSYAIRKAFQDDEGMALVLGRLGELALREQDFPGATRLYSQSATLYRQVNNRGGLAVALNGLGVAAIGQGDLFEAQTNLRQALHVAFEMRLIPLLLSIITSVAELFLELGDPRYATLLLAHVARNPASECETRNRVLSIQERGGIAALPTAGAGDDCEPEALDVLAVELMAELADFAHRVHS